MFEARWEASRPWREKVWLVTGLKISKEENLEKQQLVARDELFLLEIRS